MFDMGFSEIVFIVIVAVIFLGPDKLPETIRSVAKFFRKVKSITSEAKETFEKEINLQELRDEALHYRQSLQEATNDISSEFKHSVVKPIDDVRKTIKDENRELLSISMSGDSRELIDDDFEQKDKSKSVDEEVSQKSTERPTEFKNLKRGNLNA
jgi:sec-independent protein translocase protein TatB